MAFFDALGNLVGSLLGGFVILISGLLVIGLIGNVVAPTKPDSCPSPVMLSDPHPEALAAMIAAHGCANVETIGGMHKIVRAK